MSILYRAVPISNATGKILILFEDYERAIVTEALKNGMQLQVIVEPIGAEVSDGIRGFFYGHVFKWAANVYEKHTQEKIYKDKTEFGKELLKAIYKQEFERLKNEKEEAEQAGEQIEFCGIEFNVGDKPLSFSRTDSNKRIMQAIDIWTLWFAETLQETFPQPDKDWRVKK